MQVARYGLRVKRVDQVVQEAIYLTDVFVRQPFDRTSHAQAILYMRNPQPVTRNA